MRQGTCLRAVTVGTAALLATVVALASPASAERGSPDRSGAAAGAAAAVEAPPTREAPRGSRSYAEQGTRTERGTCLFDTEGRRHVDEGPAVLFLTELSYDPVRCRRTMAEVRYRPNQVPPAIAERLAAGDSDGGKGREAIEKGQRQPKRAVDDGARVAAVIPYTLSVQVWWEDPVYIDLTMTRATVGWAYTTPDYLLYGPSYHEAYWYWFDTSGWQRNSYNHLFYNDGYLNGTNVVGQFSNPSFYLPIICNGSGQTTYAAHNLTYAWAANYGYYGWALQSEKSGNCANGMYGSYVVSLV